MRKPIPSLLAAATAALLTTGCGSPGGGPATEPPPTSPSASASPSPSVAPTSAAPTTRGPAGDLTLALVKPADGPSCYLMWRVQPLAPGGPPAGAFWFTISFELRGLAASGPAKVSIKTSAGDSWTMSFTDVTEASRNFSEPITDNRYFRGPVTVTLMADPENAVPETNERNNVLKAQLTVSRKGAPKTPSASRCTRLS